MTNIVILLFLLHGFQNLLFLPLVFRNVVYFKDNCEINKSLKRNVHVSGYNGDYEHKS